MLTRSGRDGVPEIASEESAVSGAALSFGGGTGPCFLRFKELGTNEVASFLKSRNSGSAEIVAAAKCLCWILTLVLPEEVSDNCPRSGGWVC